MSVLAEKTEAGAVARGEVMSKVMDTTADYLSMLECRWQDEKEYEPFSDYIEAFRKFLAAKCPDVVLIEGRKGKPFGFIIQPAGFPFRVLLFATARHVGWKVSR